MSFRRLSVFVLLAFAGGALADATSDRIQAYEQKSSQVMRNLQYLCDHIGPRLSGSPQFAQASEWAAGKMREYGLANVHREEWLVPHGWERGTIRAAVVKPLYKPLAVAALGWTPSTHGTLKGRVVALAPDSPAQRARYEGKLRGAIILRGAPDKEPSYLRRPEGTSEKQRRDPLGQWLATQHVGAIVRDSGKPFGLLNMTGTWLRSGPTSVFMTNEDYGMLYRLESAGEDVQMELDVRCNQTKGPVPCWNVIGEIRGGEKPDEVVVCGGHLDSWDLGTGATDNGVGSMVVLEVARILKELGIQPKRTVRFILFGGEEQGLVGSRAYVKAHEKELAHMQAALVLDTGAGRITSLGLDGNEQDRAVLQDALADLKPMGLTAFTGFVMNGTDHASFTRAGVPGFWFGQNSEEYWLTHHSQADTFDKVTDANVRQAAAVLAAAVVRVADLPNLLPRKVAGPEPTDQ